MKTVIVTGSAGLVGSEAVRQFAALGYRVVGIDNNDRAAFFGDAASTKPMVRHLLSTVPLYVHMDRHAGFAADVFATYGQYAEVVIHCAAQPSHDYAAVDPHADWMANVQATHGMLANCRRHCPSAAFVFCSTNKVYGDWPNDHLKFEEHDTRFDCSDFPNGIGEWANVDQSTHSLFGASKLAADIQVQEYGRYFGMNTVCFRGGCLTGPGHAGVEQHGFLSYLCKCAVTGTPYRVFGYGGRQVRDNIHASDLVRAFIEYVNAPTPGAVYNIGGGPERSCSVLEAIALAERITGRKMNVEHVAEPRKGDHKWWITDTQRFQAAYPKWKQEYTLEATMREIIAAQQERCAA